MAQLEHTFDANTVEPSAPRELLSPGDYQAQIVQSEMKGTPKGGQRLVLEFEIVDGPSKGRRIWEGLNLVNSNPKAVDIANRDLSAICHAIGRMTVSDSDELHFVPMTVKVQVEPGQGAYGPKNIIKGYEKIGGAKPAASTPHAAMNGTKPAAAAPPWRRTAA